MITISNMDAYCNWAKILYKVFLKNIYFLLSQSSVFWFPQ